MLQAVGTIAGNSPCPGWEALEWVKPLSGFSYAGAQRCAADDAKCYRWDPSADDVATGISRGKAIIGSFRQIDNRGLAAQRDAGRTAGASKRRELRASRYTRGIAHCGPVM